MADDGGTADSEPPVPDASELYTLADPGAGAVGPGVDADGAPGPEDDGDQWRQQVISMGHEGRRRRRSSVRDVIEIIKERTNMNEDELEDAIARDQGVPVPRRSSSFMGIPTRKRASTFTRSTFETAVRDTGGKYQRRATLLVQQAEKFITKEGTRR